MSKLLTDYQSIIKFYINVNDFLAESVARYGSIVPRMPSLVFGDIRPITPTEQENLPAGSMTGTAVEVSSSFIRVNHGYNPEQIGQGIVNRVAERTFTKAAPLFQMFGRPVPVYRKQLENESWKAYLEELFGYLTQQLLSDDN